MVAWSTQGGVIFTNRLDGVALAAGWGHTLMLNNGVGTG